MQFNVGLVGVPEGKKLQKIFEEKMANINFKFDENYKPRDCRKLNKSQSESTPRNHSQTHISKAEKDYFFKIIAAIKKFLIYKRIDDNDQRLLIRNSVSPKALSRLF